MRKHLPEYVPGGRSIGYTISVEVRLRKGDVLTIGTGDSKIPIGQVIKFKVEKNKTYKPYMNGEFDFYFDEGGTVPPGHIDNAKELIIEAIMYGIIDKKGSWFSYKDIKLGQGKETAIEFIRNDEALFDEIRAKTVAVAFESDVEREDVYEEGIIEDPAPPMDFDKRQMPPKIVDEDFVVEAPKKSPRRKK